MPHWPALEIWEVRQSYYDKIHASQQHRLSGSAESWHGLCGECRLHDLTVAHLLSDAAEAITIPHIFFSGTVSKVPISSTEATDRHTLYSKRHAGSRLRV